MLPSPVYNTAARRLSQCTKPHIHIRTNAFRASLPLARLDALIGFATVRACGAQQAGARTRVFGGTFLHSLPHYAPESRTRTDAQLELIEAVRGADAVIIATPGYHGGISGLVKNALDTLEELNHDERPYLDGRAVGCIVTAYGWQAAGAVLGSLRSVVHALRGWPTPFGAAVNTLETRFESAGSCSDPKVVEQLASVGRQSAEFALAFGAHRASGGIKVALQEVPDLTVVANAR
jgi:FMN reductase